MVTINWLLILSALKSSRKWIWFYKFPLQVPHEFYVWWIHLNVSVNTEAGRVFAISVTRAYTQLFQQSMHLDPQTWGVTAGLLWDQRKAVEGGRCSVLTLSLNTVKRTDTSGRELFLPDLSWGLLCSEMPFSFNCVCVCMCTCMCIGAFEHTSNPLFSYRDPRSAWSQLASLIAIS